MSWNQGNGQDDVYGRLNNTRDVGAPRFPFIEAGTHKLALCSLEEFQHASDGACARALFEVYSSNKHQIGSYVVKIWKLVKPAKYQGQASDADMFADFCRKLKGAPAGHPIGNDIRVLMKERVAEQLARGTMIECVGIPNKKGTWTNIYWNAIPQTQADIVASRQRVEAKGIPNSSGGSGGSVAGFTAAPVAAPAASPAPQGGFLAQLPVDNKPSGGTW